VGDGAARQSLVDLVARERLDNVVLVPAQPKARMPEYWSLCDVALIHLKNDPVFAEVIPSKIFEAMAMGLPLLAVCPRGEATRIVSSCEAGWVVPPEAPGALADVAVSLSGDPARVRHAAARSLASAPRFSRQRQADDMLAVLEAVVEGNGGRAAEALSHPD
jgi:glycosyltransferase involved in cell wall biosynthesis